MKAIRIHTPGGPEALKFDDAPEPTPGAGVVTAVGTGVTDVKIGDTVAWTGVPGSYAQMAVVPADRLVKLPPGVEPKVGAAAMLQGLTAPYLVRSSYPLKKGDTC